MIRQQPIQKSWVIFSTARGQRPKNHVAPPPSQGQAPRGSADAAPSCPFCVGPHGPDRSPILVQAGEDGTWERYVLPNKYPALCPTRSPQRERDGIFLSVGGFGVAEVVVETRAHDSPLESRSDADLRALFHIYRQRVLDLYEDERINQVIVFKNSGAQAGASQAHPHSQIYGIPIVPGHIRQQIGTMRAFYDNEGGCPACFLNAEEIRRGERLVLQTPEVVALCPFASEVPWEVHLYPMRHVTCLGLCDDLALEELAVATKTVLGALTRELGSFSYNLVFDSAPRDDRDAPFFHARIRLVPRLQTPAGFEIATGIRVNTVFPEEAARHLRQHLTL